MEKSTEVGKRSRYLLTLSRRGLFDTSDSGKSGSNNNGFFAMDYFDGLEIREMDGERDMSEFMGMTSKLNSVHIPEISVQNYAIYTDCYSKEECTSVFFDNTSRYLSLLHVYITPDVLAGLSKEYLETDYIKLFEEDLVEISKEFEKESGSSSVVFRMLSVCDFMIVIRSKAPETGFELSTKVRKRMISKEDDKKESLVAYKTYTILTIDGSCVVADDENSLGEKEESFAIRGRYSNKYWKKNNYKGQSIDKVPDDIIHLHGRYDFLLYLSGAEFQSIFPRLQRAKRIWSDGKYDETPSEKCNYLRYLIDNDYLSYVNERYLVRGNLGEAFDVNRDYIKKLKLDKEYIFNGFLSEKIQNRCNEILKRICDIKQKSKKILKESMLESIDMLYELACLCGTINGLADVRIYAISLFKQLEVVLDSLEECLKNYEETEKTDEEETKKLYDYLEMYLRRSVVVLEAYSSTIRGNNFQTLHSPRYSIVSGCSIEKILIGYSRFLNSMMKFRQEVNSKELGGKCFLPVMIPDLKVDMLSVEVLFPNISFGDYYIKNSDTLFAAVTGPANKALVEVSDIVPTLFHELAHNFRYERRSQRNEVLLKILMNDCAINITVYLFENVLGFRENETYKGDLYKIFIKIVEESLGEEIKSMKIDMELSLRDYSNKLQDVLNQELILLASNKDALESEILEFVCYTNEYISNSDMKELEKIYFYLNKILKIEIDDISSDIKTFKEELKGAIGLYVEGCINKIEEENSDEKVALNKIKESLRTFINKYEVFTIEGGRNRGDYKELRDRFYRRIYDELQKEWNKLVENSLTTDKKEWLKLGRKLGIDYYTPNNFQTFANILLQAIKQSKSYDFNKAFMKLEIYREETSDIFMCNMCDFTLKEYLLLCVRNYPSIKGKLAKGNIDRITDIVLIQWGMKVLDKTLSWQEWVVKSFGELYHELCDSDVYSEMSIDKIVKCLMSYSKETKYSTIRRRIALLSLYIISDIPERFNRLDKRAYLVEDFKRGRDYYKEIYKKFLDNSSYDIECIKDLFGGIKKYMEGFCETGTEAYNNACENFFASMYYYDKLTYAIEGGSI